MPMPFNYVPLNKLSRWLGKKDVDFRIMWGNLTEAERDVLRDQYWHDHAV